MNSSSAGGRRGRPRDPQREQQVRQALLEAAVGMLQHMTYRDISIRQLARRAGVNSAMISYHFGSKEGLVVAALKTQLLQAAPKQIAVDASAAQSPQLQLQQAVDYLVRLYVRQPWIPRMIIDEVAAKEGRLRELFIEQIAREKGQMLMAVVSSLSQSGRLRGNPNPQFMLVSVLSLVAFPFIAAPLLQQAFDFSLDEDSVDHWISHITHLLLGGWTGVGSEVSHASGGGHEE